MSTICELHDKAMSLMNFALKMKAAHDIDTCAKFLEACEFEAGAAYLVEKTPATEPSRGMLFLGAASLAWHGQDYELAERLVAEGLSGFPTVSVQEDLRKLYDDIKFSKYMEKNGPTIDEAEANIRLYGGSVGYGRVPVKTLISHIQAFESIVERTTQRKAGLPFQARSKKFSKSLLYRMDVELAEAGSFGVKLRLSRQKNTQISMFQPPAKEIMQEVLATIELLDNGDTEQLKKVITNDDYFINFVSHARDLAPDGDQISSVGIATRNREIAFKHPRKKIQELMRDMGEATASNADENVKTIHGCLKVSDGLKGEFQIVEANGTPVKLKVRDGLDDMARKYFGEVVDATCKKKGKSYELVDITPTE